MPDTFDATGLTVQTASELTEGLTTGLQGIYGADIMVDQNAADGQVIGIYTQGGVDVREVLAEVNASFDPDQAVGIQLDQRCAINGVARNGATYTVQPVSITVNKTVILAGLDANYNSASGTGYTVTDGNGNNFILAATTTFNSGTTVANFRAAQIGAVSVPINTLTTPVTIVSGVTGVNNPSAAESVGQTEETDPQLRVRRARSVALTSFGYLNGLEAALLALPGVTGAVVYENVTDTVDGNGVPAHGIWCIVEGGSNSDVANCIFQKRGYGCNMKGSVTVDETSPSGIIVPISWDVPTPEPLYFAFTIRQTVAGFSFDTTAIKAYIAANLSYEVGAFAETSNPTAVALAAINASGGGGVPVLMTISIDDATWTDFLEPTTPASQFTVAAADINITVVT